MTPRPRPVPPLLAAALLGLAACGGNTAEPAAPVVIEGYAFPALTAAPGATITVTNADAEPHTVTADDGSFATEAFDSSAPGTLVAPAEPGTYPVHCEIHPSMRGTLTVR
jgi:plastocyanin